MKKSSILDYFSCQNVATKVTCPACNLLIMKSKLNEHLDSACSSTLNPIKVNPDCTSIPQSSYSSDKQRSSNLKKQKTSTKLNLKNQRTKNHFTFKKTSSQISNNDSDCDVEIIKEITTFQCSDKSDQTRENLKKSNNDLNSERIENSILTDHLSTQANCLIGENSQNLPINPVSLIEKNPRILDMNPVSLIKEDLPNLPVNPVSNKKSNKRSLTFSSSSRPLKAMKSSCSNMKVPPKSYSVEQPLNKSDKNFENETDFKKECPLLEGELKMGEVIAKTEKNINHNSCSKEEITEKALDSNDTNVVEKQFLEEQIDLKMLEDASAFSELSDNDEEEAKEAKPKEYIPYYIANFKFIVENVMNESDNKILFNEEDLSFVKAFNSLTEASQKIYVRLFQRKYKWLRIDKINYPEITTDTLACLEELFKAGLVDSGSCDIDLETALNLLSLPEAKNVAKHFNFNSGKNKEEIKSMLVKHSKQHKSVFFTNGPNGIAKMMLKKVRQVIGPCYRLSLLPKKLFTRILMLFNLTLLSEDDDDSAAGGQQQQLLTLLQVNKGELKFPDYKQTKETVIFADRDELIRYEEARQLETDIFIAAEHKEFEEAKKLFIEAKEEFEDQCSKSFMKRAKSLPVFLKKYTSFHVYIRCMTQGVEILQRLREYKDAVSLLRKLLKQKEFCQDYKGRWYDRLALNLEQHLRKPQEALDEIKKALEDKNVRVGHRYSLLLRALRITKSFDDEDEFKKQLLREAEVVEAPKVIIKGRLCPRSILGRRHVFISSASVGSNEDDVTVLGVEQLTIEHYKGEGYPEGIHGEGSTFISLYALLFWDIIYDGNIPDVFISPYQTHPMDLNSELFFRNREKLIISHLETIRNSTNDELKEIVKITWENNHGRASLVSWDRFTDLEHVQGLACCFGNHILGGICERLARDFRFTRSGVPDLVVWNPDSLKIKIIEVKGPGDKLSSKQILWLDYLIKLGADAEVCLVEAVASKKLRKGN